MIVVIISLIVSVIIVVIYKFMTDQNLMKELKDEMKELQNEMKTLRDNPQKMMEVQRRAMQTNMKYMGHSMKSTLVTFIPIILIFGWMNAHVAFEPIVPNEEFSIDVSFDKNSVGTVKLTVPEGVEIVGENTKEIGKSVTFFLKGAEGDYIDQNALQFEFNEQIVYKELIITNEQRYANPLENGKGDLKRVQINNKKTIVLNLFGWRLGWLGTYIIFSIIFSMILRKILKVY